jgi:hypothetical protein
MSKKTHKEIWDNVIFQKQIIIGLVDVLEALDVFYGPDDDTIDQLFKRGDFVSMLMKAHKVKKGY